MFESRSGRINQNRQLACCCVKQVLTDSKPKKKDVFQLKKFPVRKLCLY
jgi:hypothetical protein